VCEEASGVMLALSDAGCWIEKEIRRILGSYLTANEPDEGAGLGPVMVSGTRSSPRCAP